LDYLGKYCQLKKIFNLVKILIFFYLGACSQFGNQRSDITVVEPIPQWLKVEPRFAHRSEEGYYSTHSFFDFIPLADLKNNKVNFVLMTPIDAKFGYDINLHSGQVYKKYEYCPQNDIWRSYTNEINLPPYSEGFVPRVLDQLGGPLKIIVFGAEKYLSNTTPEKQLSQRVRVVGGVIQQYCENFPCARRSEWRSRLVLLAVNYLDPKFKDVTTITKLKSEINWKEFKAFFENGYGRLIRGKDERPAFRLFGAIGAKEAFKYAFSKGHLFKFNEMKKLRAGCHRLYDHVWSQVKMLQSNLDKEKYLSSRAGSLDNDAMIVDVKKSIFIKNRKNREKYSKDELNRSSKGPRSFRKLFNNFYKKYGQRFFTCNELVRSSNALKNPKRHWFFTYLEAYMNLEDLGYIFHCGKRAWIRNSFLANGQKQFDKVSMKKSCTNNDLESSFDKAITLLSSLKKGAYPHYYYVLYDQGHGGSHNRLFSWVKSTGKKLVCKEKKIDYRNEEFFPPDINWSYFHSKGR
jgi:hypothetical protein